MSKLARLSLTLELKFIKLDIYGEKLWCYDNGKLQQTLAKADYLQLSLSIT